MKFSFVPGKRLVLFLHLAAWTILFIIPVYLFSLDSGRDVFFIARVYLRTIIYILIFYVNFFWFIPRLLFKGKRMYYYLAASALVVSMYLLNVTFDKYVFEEPKFEREAMDEMKKEFKFAPRHPHRFDIYNFLFTSILISGFSVGLRMTGRYQENEEKRKELEKEKLNSELAFLKNQISPHFFFNTLNNIYSLVQINTDDAQKAILQLSKLMRYLLYESEQGNTVLSREIDFMKNYIDLMKLRITEKTKLQVDFPESYPEHKIPPLLFIPFIENAFKHGISNREKSYISVLMRVDESKIYFLCSNSLFAKENDKSLESSGVGLENVRKRLTLLFPEKHVLKVNETANAFEVELRIEIN